MLPVLNDIAKDPSYTNNETITKYSDSIKVIQDQVGVGTAIGMEKGPLVQAGVLTSQGLDREDVPLDHHDKTDVEAAPGLREEAQRGLQGRRSQHQVTRRRGGERSLPTAQSER